MSPIFVYACPKGHKTEWLMRFGQKPPERCPDCGRKVEREISAHNTKPDGTYSYREDAA